MNNKRYVLGFLFNEIQDQVVLIEKQNPVWQRGKLNGVGGKIESTDPTPLAAMIREFKEETGVEYFNWTQFFTMEFDNTLMYLFRATNQSAFESVRTVEQEIITPVSIHSLPDNVIPNLRVFIPMAINSLG